jgi:large subunit ribosomal protein L3
MTASTEVVFFVYRHMISSLLGTKIKQTQEFTADGKRIPVTFVQAGPCFITGIDGKNRIQLGIGLKKNITKATEGHLKKAGLTQKLRFLRTIPVQTATDDLKVGQEIKASEVFVEGENVRVTGTSKGKGFAGVVKRHGFHGGPRTHGQSDRERAPGSIGQTTTPGRVYRGKRMAGRMGSDTVTLKGLKIVSVEAETNIVKVKGLIPGGVGSLVIITKE